jgi:ubiquinone biosynthesis protein
MGPKAKINKLLKQFPEFAEQFPEIPSLLYKALDNAAHAQQQTAAHNRELALLREQMESGQRTTTWAVLISALLISAAILLQ